MIPTSYLASTVVMGMVLLALALAFGRANPRRSYRAVRTVGVAERTRPSRRRWETLSAGALLLVVAVAVGGLLVAGATDALQDNAWMAAGGLLGLAVVGYLAWGVHHSVRFRGRPNSVAVGVSLWALGLLFVAVVAVKLILG